MFACFCLKSAIFILTLATSLVTASYFNLFLFTGSIKHCYISSCVPQALSFKTPLEIHYGPKYYDSILHFYQFTDILLWKNVAGYNGSTLTAVWMLSYITVEIMVAYDPLNLDSIFTVTKISYNV